MKKIITETISNQEPRDGDSVSENATGSQTLEYCIYFFLGVLEVLLAFRLILKVTGASLASSFVGLIYNVTGLFIMPFEGIFRRAVTQGIETTAVLEPATLVAMVVYAVLIWGIVALLRISTGKQQ
jgi:hypothetical protein